jgi:hypothetical protein
MGAAPHSGIPGAPLADVLEHENGGLALPRDRHSERPDDIFEEVAVIHKSATGGKLPAH